MKTLTYGYLVAFFAFFRPISQQFRKFRSASYPETMLPSVFSGGATGRRNLVLADSAMALASLSVGIWGFLKARWYMVLLCWICGLICGTALNGAFVTVFQKVSGDIYNRATPEIRLAAVSFWLCLLLSGLAWIIPND